MYNDKMSGRKFRPLACPYGCCIPDWKSRKKIRKRTRTIEKRQWKREAN